MATALFAVTAVLLVVLFVRLSSTDDEGRGLGDDVFRFDARRLAAEIDDRGPVLFPDLRNRDLIVYVNHLGDDVDAGWVAVDARPPGSECEVRWVRSRFVDRCTGMSYPADGTGLRRFAAEVNEDGDVVIDLREGPTTTS